MVPEHHYAHHMGHEVEEVERNHIEGNTSSVTVTVHLNGMSLILINLSQQLSNLHRKMKESFFRDSAYVQATILTVANLPTMLSYVEEDFGMIVRFC